MGTSWKKGSNKGKIAVLADTSGSIYDEDIALFAKFRK